MRLSYEQIIGVSFGDFLIACYFLFYFLFTVILSFKTRALRFVILR
jgi:hypothetical protein